MPARLGYYVGLPRSSQQRRRGEAPGGSADVLYARSRGGDTHTGMPHIGNSPPVGVAKLLRYFSRMRKTDMVMLKEHHHHASDTDPDAQGDHNVQ